MKAEEILQKSANRNMKRWELESFRITHPTLYKTIIEAINEALIIGGAGSTLVDNGVPVFGTKKFNDMCSNLFSGKPKSN